MEKAFPAAKQGVEAEIGDQIERIWDERAEILRKRREMAKGQDRRHLSKQLHEHLRRKKAERQIEECKKKGEFFFQFFAHRPRRKTVIVDENGNPMGNREAMKQLGDCLALK
eukprot:1924724-Amphidinium_carterae.1